MKRVAKGAEIIGSASEKNKNRQIGHSRSLSREDLSVGSSVVFANFNSAMPNKFLEDAINNGDYASFYAGLQHGVVCDNSSILNDKILIDILGNPIENDLSPQERYLFLHLKAFTIMASLGNCSGFPRSKDDFDDTLVSSISKNSYITMQFDEREKEEISLIIADQFYTNSGMMYLLSVHIASSINIDQKVLQVMYDIYRLYAKDRDVSELCRDEHFRGSLISDSKTITYGSVLDYISRVRDVATYASYEEYDFVCSRSSASYSFI